MTSQYIKMSLSSWTVRLGSSRTRGSDTANSRGYKKKSRTRAASASSKSSKSSHRLGAMHPPTTPTQIGTPNRQQARVKIALPPPPAPKESIDGIPRWAPPKSIQGEPEIYSV